MFDDRSHAPRRGVLAANIKRRHDLERQALLQQVFWFRKSSFQTWGRLIMALVVPVAVVSFFGDAAADCECCDGFCPEASLSFLRDLASWDSQSSSGHTWTYMDIHAWLVYPWTYMDIHRHTLNNPCLRKYIMDMHGYPQTPASAPHHA